MWWWKLWLRQIFSRVQYWYTKFYLYISSPISWWYITFGVKSWANVRTTRVVLVLFEVISYLKVNFHKSMMVGININDSWLNEVAVVLSCKVGMVSFMYFGLPIGGDARRLLLWESILSHIKNRLPGWKSWFLSFDGRLILLKFALSSLSVYTFSFFKAP